MFLKILQLGNMDNNCYIIGDEVSKQAAVIDAPDSASEILDVLENENLTLKFILLTHYHFDHVGALDALKEATNAKVAIHTFEADGLCDPTVNLALYADAPCPQAPADIRLKDTDIITFGDVKIKVLYTPGHTIGSVCYYIEKENMLFSGDTLFFRNIGRTDFPGGDDEIIEKSIRKQLYILPDETDVFPGHGMTTVIEYEKKNGYFKA